MSRQPYEWWQSAMAGAPLPIYDDPECGYYKVRDRRGEYRDAPPIKRPWVACAIWLGEDGAPVAELAGQPCAVEAIWPYCAKNPIDHETYAAWHETGMWPEKAVA